MVVVLPRPQRTNQLQEEETFLARHVALIHAVEVSKLFLNFIFTLVTKLLKAGFAHRSTLAKRNYFNLVSLL